MVALKAKRHGAETEESEAQREECRLLRTRTPAMSTSWKRSIYCSLNIPSAQHRNPAPAPAIPQRTPQFCHVPVFLQGLSIRHYRLFLTFLRVLLNPLFC